MWGLTLMAIHQSFSTKVQIHKYFENDALSDFT